MSQTSFAREEYSTWSLLQVKSFLQKNIEKEYRDVRPAFFVSLHDASHPRRKSFTLPSKYLFSVGEPLFVRQGIDSAVTKKAGRTSGIEEKEKSSAMLFSLQMILRLYLL